MLREEEKEWEGWGRGEVLGKRRREGRVGEYGCGILGRGMKGYARGEGKVR